MKRETKKIREELQNIYIGRLDNELRKRGIDVTTSVAKVKDDYELNKKIIRSYENKIPKTIKNKIKNKTYN